MTKEEVGEALATVKGVGQHPNAGVAECALVQIVIGHQAWGVRKSRTSSGRSRSICFMTSIAKSCYRAMNWTTFVSHAR